MEKWDNPDTKELIKVLLSLKSASEAKNFLRDLLTEKELVEFGKRWRVAKMLNQGTPYTQIVSETGLSSTTVARISKWLVNGKGYKTMLARRSR